MSGGKTPPFGYQLAELKQDLRDSIERDEADHKRLFDSLGIVQEHVSNLRLESAQNASSLARIEVAVKSRARLQTEVKKTHRTLYQVLGGVLIAIITSVATYLAQH